MAIIDATRFFSQCRTNGEFRKRLYGDAQDETTEGSSFRKMIAAAGYDFSDAEAEDALRSLLLRAADEYEADEIKDLGQWYRFMIEGDGPATDAQTGAQPDGATGGCSPSACAACSLCH